MIAQKTTPEYSQNNPCIPIRLMIWSEVLVAEKADIISMQRMSPHPKLLKSGGKISPWSMIVMEPYPSEYPTYIKVMSTRGSIFSISETDSLSWTK